MATVKEEGYLKGLSDEALGKKLKETLREIDAYTMQLEQRNNLLGLLEAEITKRAIERIK
jgi:hypothetical protein